MVIVACVVGVDSPAFVYCLLEGVILAVILDGPLVENDLLVAGRLEALVAVLSTSKRYLDVLPPKLAVNDMIGVDHHIVG